MNLIAIFPSGATELTVNGLHQWDYGRKLDIHAPDLPAIVEVHFACPGMDEAIVRVCSTVDGVATVAIPDRCLEQSSPITAWVYEVGETYGQTIKTLTLNIMTRTRPQTAGAIDPETSDKYTEAVAAMNETIEALKHGDIKVEAAEFSDGTGKTLTQDVDSESALYNLAVAHPYNSLAVYAVDDINIDTEEDYFTVPYGSRGYMWTLNDGAYYAVFFDSEYSNIYTVHRDPSGDIERKDWEATFKPSQATEADSAGVAGALNLSPANIIHDAATSGAVESVSISEPGLYALYIRDDVNGVKISQTVYVYSLTGSFNVSIPGGTLTFNALTDTANAYFGAISSDLQYNLDIMKVVKIAGFSS